MAAPVAVGDTRIELHIRFSLVIEQLRHHRQFAHIHAGGATAGWETNGVAACEDGRRACREAQVRSL